MLWSAPISWRRQNIVLMHGGFVDGSADMNPKRRSFGRKLPELPLTLLLESALGKSRILEFLA